MDFRAFLQNSVYFTFDLHHTSIRKYQLEREGERETETETESERERERVRERERE